jgi:hypothetical protein
VKVIAGMVVSASYTPSPSGRGLGRGDKIKELSDLHPLILSFSRREKGRWIFMRGSGFVSSGNDGIAVTTSKKEIVGIEQC